MKDANHAVNTVDNVLENLEASITCPQCSDVFKDPRLSVCLHSFCYKCLEQLWNHNSSKPTFRCPICQTDEAAPVEGQASEVSNSPSNLHLNRLLEINKVKKLTEEHGICDNCKETTMLEVFCFDCDVFLCTPCMSAHAQMTVKKKHRERKLNDFQSVDYDMLYRRPIYCEHERKDLEGIEFYCPECDAYMCGLCNIVDEEYHATKDIQEITDISKTEIGEKAAIVRGKCREIQAGIQNTEKRMAEIDSRVDALKNEVNVKVANLVQILTNHGEEMVQVLEDIRSGKKDKLLTQKRQFETLNVQTTSSLEFVDSLLGREFAAEIITLRDRVISRLEKMGDLIVDTRPVEGSGIEYVPNPTLVSTLESASIGEIVVSSTDPLSCFAEGEGLRKAFVGEETCLSVTTRDLKGDECYSAADRVTVEATSNCGEVIVGEVKDLENGLYDVTYVPKVDGIYALAIKVGDQHIQESPFEVIIKPPVMLPFKSFGSVAGANGLFTQPHGIAISSTGDIAISDTQKHCVHLLDSNGLSKMDFGGEELDYPVGIAFDIAEKHIIVADRDNHRLLVYSTKTGKVIRKIGRRGSAQGEFDGPSGICVDGEGRIIVADWNNHRIQVFSPEGIFLFKFGDTVKNKLKHPRAVTFCNVRKRFVVSDTGNNVVKVFGPKGKFLSTVGKPGVRKGELYSPRGVTVDKLDRIVVCDFDNHRVQFFRFDGTCLNSFGSKGKTLGQFNRPMGVALLNNDQIVVSDWGNDRIQVFSMGPERKVSLLHENNNFSI
ncbi:hypothetical protein ACROYT_G041063 [Oculina patagonica]